MWTQCFLIQVHLWLLLWTSDSLRLSQGIQRLLWSVNGRHVEISIRPGTMARSTWLTIAEKGSRGQKGRAVQDPKAAAGWERAAAKLCGDTMGVYVKKSHDEICPFKLFTSTSVYLSPYVLTSSSSCLKPGQRRKFPLSHQMSHISHLVLPYPTPMSPLFLLRGWTGLNCGSKRYIHIELVNVPLFRIRVFADVIK